MRAQYTEAIRSLADNYALIADVIDAEDSEAWKDGSFTGFRTDDIEFILEGGKEPATAGSLKTGCSVSDALVLQYYEEPDAVKAAFGKELTFDQWRQISEVKDVYVDALYATPLTASTTAHLLLQEIQSEMNTKDRIFTFLCGHDSNLAGVFSALDVAEFELPKAIETRTPIGSKMVFSKWLSADGKAFWSVDLVYQSTEQLRGMPLLDLENPPVIFHLALNGLEQNPDGLYTAEDLQGRFDEAINAYDQIVDGFTDYALELEEEYAVTE